MDIFQEENIDCNFLVRAYLVCLQKIIIQQRSEGVIDLPANCVWQNWAFALRSLFVTPYHNNRHYHLPLVWWPLDVMLAPQMFLLLALLELVAGSSVNILEKSGLHKFLKNIMSSFSLNKSRRWNRLFICYNWQYSPGKPWQNQPVYKVQDSNLTAIQQLWYSFVINGLCCHYMTCSEFGLLVSLVEFEPLSYWSAHDCDWAEYKGCTKNRKARAKDRWGHARSFGQISLGSIM